jgi:hypothetical protein
MLARLPAELAVPLPAMSLRWAGLILPDRSHIALYHMNRARSAKVGPPVPPLAPP